MLKDNIKVKGLRDCPLCGHSVLMRKNASKKFQVYCPKCHCKSDWLNKVEAIIYWYNMAELHDKLHGNKRADERTPEE